MPDERNNTSCGVAEHVQATLNCIQHKGSCYCLSGDKVEGIAGSCQGAKLTQAAALQPEA
jgi:hypothetical protein